MLSEAEFKKVTKEIYELIFDSFEDYDPDIVEADFHMDNVSITFADGTKFIVNRQTPIQQLWLAVKGKGYHFNLEPETQRWVCDKTGACFAEVFSKHVSEKLGAPYELAF